jgi:NAD/NADP transhydrogenase beta subunit
MIIGGFGGGGDAGVTIKGIETTDVVFVVGANDVYNPPAHDHPGSPIYGMPIINAEQANNVIVMK